MRLLLAIGVLGGCTTSLYNPPPGRSSADAATDATTYVVRPGDTLYSIAARHGLDWRALTQWNRLSDPDVLFVGQRLTLVPPGASRTERAPAAAPAAVAARPAANPKRSTAPARRAPPSPEPSSPPPAWQWPTAGTVASTFGSSSGIATGIGIRGTAGQPIYAAAPGRVVYAGRGLIGYGELVIIRHNDTYLTAYGYNDRLLVAQGDEVARGTQIATMGLGPGREPRLHFEIRRNGVPVDPLLYLPPRR
ncbi:MAG TPA: peptidoglycan DD-metalloendopeptidase family protein [Gammaproteobacteria bacterium]